MYNNNNILKITCLLINIIHIHIIVKLFFYYLSECILKYVYLNYIDIVSSCGCTETLLSCLYLMLMNSFVNKNSNRNVNHVNILPL